GSPPPPTPSPFPYTTLFRSKTTFSAATAFWLAEQGKKVLVFSVDPQASLSDIFQQDIFGKGPVKIMDNLWAQEIDADRHIREYRSEEHTSELQSRGHLVCRL